MQTHLTVKGLVIRETSLHDADKLLDILTDEGIRTVQARSVRKPGSKYAAVTQLFAYGEFCLRISGERFYLDSAVSLNQFYGLRNDLEALALASYFSEVLRKTATDQPQPQILRLFLLALHHLSEHDRPVALVKAAFELRLMAELGMMPNLVCCCACLTYLPEHPVLRIRAADLICAGCIPHTELSAQDIRYPVTQSALQAARHAIYADLDRLFSFRVKGESAQQFYDYAESYLLGRLGVYLQTLKFYHSLTDVPE